MELDKNRDERIFDFVMTVPSVIDKEGETMPDNEMEEALDGWLINGAPISMEHTNKIVGKGLRWWRAEYGGNKAYVGRGKINNGQVGDIAWQAIKDGKYKDVSIGGAAFSPTKMTDGSTELRDLEILEVALCEEGMHPNADILDYNKVAKGTYFFAKGKISTIEKKPQESTQTANCACLSKEPIKGGTLMVKDEEKEPKEKEPVKKPEEDEEKKKSYVTAEDLAKAFESFEKELIKKIRAPVETLAEAKKEASPDGTEEDSPQGEPSDAESDKGKGSKETADLSKLPNSNKAIAELVKAEVAKALKGEVTKSSTPRPSQAGDDKNDFAYEVAKGTKKANFAEIREMERERLDNEAREILGR